MSLNKCQCQWMSWQWVTWHMAGGIGSMGNLHLAIGWLADWLAGWLAGCWVSGLGTGDWRLGLAGGWLEAGWALGWALGWAVLAGCELSCAVAELR